jgi:peptidoglycan/LPS O-acetylase OafA/YrhL
MARVYGSALLGDWRAHWQEFARARFARIYPLFALTTLVMVFQYALSETPLPKVSFSNGTLILQPLLLQVWASSLSWNFPSWSLCDEAYCYALFLFTVRPLLRGAYARLVAAGCMAMLVAISVVHHGSMNMCHGPSSMLRALSEFILGVLICRERTGEASERHARLMLISGWGLGGIAVFVHQDCLIVGALACLVFYAVGARRRLSTILNSSTLTALGNWSYSIYLWHVPTLYAVIASFAVLGHPVAKLSEPRALVLLTATVPAVLAVSAFSYRYFEMPMRRLLTSQLIWRPKTPRHWTPKKASP